MKQNLTKLVVLISVSAPLLAAAAVKSEQGPNRVVCSKCFPAGTEGKKACYNIFNDGKKTGENCSDEMSSSNVAYDQCSALKTSDSRCYGG